MIATTFLCVFLVCIHLFSSGYTQVSDDLYRHVPPSVLSGALPPYSSVTDVSGLDIGVEELRSVGRSVTRRTLSKWQRDNDLTTQDDTLLELLKDNPWTHFSIREGGRNTVNFRPRLGRDEEIVFTETSRSPPFAPRLGRVIHFSPRFERLSVSNQQ